MGSCRTSPSPLSPSGLQEERKSECATHACESEHSSMIENRKQCQAIIFPSLFEHRFAERVSGEREKSCSESETKRKSCLKFLRKLRGNCVKKWHLERQQARRAPKRKINITTADGRWNVSSFFAVIQLAMHVATRWLNKRDHKRSEQLSLSLPRLLQGAS